MYDQELISGISIHLNALGQGLFTPEHKIRATTLLTEACERDSMIVSRQDFLTALMVLKHL
jgi:hypothetical protein